MFSITGAHATFASFQLLLHGCIFFKKPTGQNLLLSVKLHVHCSFDIADQVVDHNVIKRLCISLVCSSPFIFSFQLEAYNEKRGLGRRLGSQISPKTIILMPHNLGGNHWVLLQFDVAAKVGQVYDSLPSMRGIFI